MNLIDADLAAALRNAPKEPSTKSDTPFTDYAVASINTVARELAKQRAQSAYSTCNFCGRSVQMTYSTHLGIVLELCPRCGCEGFSE